MISGKRGLLGGIDVVFFKHLFRFVFPKALVPIKLRISVFQKPTVLSKRNAVIKFITEQLLFNWTDTVLTFSVIECCGYKVIPPTNCKTSGTDFAQQISTLYFAGWAEYLILEEEKIGKPAL
jgi:hypothetical protein